MCQCWCTTSGCSKPVPFFDGLPYHFDNSPACPSTRQTLDGLTATVSASSIINVSRQRVFQMEADNGLLLPILQPEIAGNPAVVLVHLAVAFPPVVELAGCDIEPPNEPPGADLGLLRPAPDEIHDLIPRVVRNPGPFRSPIRRGCWARGISSRSLGPSAPS